MVTVFLLSEREMSVSLSFRCSLTYIVSSGHRTQSAVKLHLLLIQKLQQQLRFQFQVFRKDTVEG